MTKQSKLTDSTDSASRIISDPAATEIRSEPKFRVGQIVILKNIKKQPPFRILAMEWSMGGWFYAWNRKNFAAENMIRAISPDEFGVDVPNFRQGTESESVSTGVEGAHEGITADKSGSREPEKLNNAQKCTHTRMEPVIGPCICCENEVALAESSLSSPPPKCACTEKMMCAFHELSGDPATAKLFQEEK